MNFGQYFRPKFFEKATIPSNRCLGPKTEVSLSYGVDTLTDDYFVFVTMHVLNFYCVIVRNATHGLAIGIRSVCLSV